ncbi:hypothetical protein GXW83_01800 [Streptacidiphilus sp. PB12-B1b]|uniref:hypothetical protein n=1 Tax=Streptacidiphilus sp. PB12-B1b TaxID=2705012 RepID=UPI0015FA84C9|nr:hypothetical protein [Streptacidiphilus sp. PB12-B1b]QMU74702.1 hypothetical protein GXW83_01800 [Streptacidiphilus sp. PB12-B1b]
MTTFSVSGVVLLAILLTIVIRNKRITFSYALLAALFGFLLAKTSAAAPIGSLLDELAGTVNSIAR